MRKFSIYLGVIGLCLLPFASLQGQDSFQFRAESGVEVYELLDGTGSFEVPFLISQVSGSPTYEVQGFSMGVAHDSTLLQATDVALSEELILMNGGAGPDYQHFNIYDDGFTMLVIFTFGATPLTMEFTTERAVAVASYSLKPDALTGDDDGHMSSLSFSDAVAPSTDTETDNPVPALANVVTVAGLSHQPIFVPGVITLTPTISVGDCDGNLQLDAVEIELDPSLDCNLNGVLDEICELLQGYGTDSNNNGIIDSCECYFPNQFTCIKTPGEQSIELTWGEAAGTDSTQDDLQNGVFIYRDDVFLAYLNNNETSFIDDGFPCSCRVKYEIEKACDNGPNAAEICYFDWVEPHPDYGFSYRAEAVDQNYTLVQGGAPTLAEVDLFISGSNDGTTTCGPAETHGFSMSMSHDPDLLSVMDVALAGVLLGVSPDYVSFVIGNDITANSSGDVGWSIGVLYTVGDGVPEGPPPETVTYETEKLVARVTYEAACGNWQNSGVTALQFEGLALNENSPTIDNVVGVCGVVYEPALATPSAQVAIIKGPAQPLFVRGDCSNQGSINIQDAVLMLNYLFSSTEITCADACDADDDGFLNLVDPLFDLMFIMGLGPMPPAPAGVCGADPTQDSLSCEISVSNNCDDPCPFEDCSNGIDDDGDGLTDCADLDCQGTSSCPSE